MKSIEDGSKIAKDGFKNENDIVEKFNDWKKDKDAQSWLIIMKYEPKEIEYVEAVKIFGYKSDVQVQVTIKLKKAIDVENLQVKLVSNPRGFNQIDKRWVDKYVEMWNIPDNITLILKRYTGEIKPNVRNTKDKRRILANEFSEIQQKAILEWLIKNQALIITDILKGRGKFAAEWMLVAQKINKNARWILRSMNYCLNFFGNGEIKISARGNFKIGRITMQRKGGDAGRETANMLQFKINPAELFEE
ncbi:MAG: type II restriction endonuclease [Candidatus Stahlbacteria bacterium]|nr:type II restriction endonuclease [Candidatus Stahlbacteria bacterium]